MPVITSAVREKLRHVKVSNPRQRLTRFPNFLIIGPQRTGTTWLHAHLRYHPQIFLSEPKELFFFSRLDKPDHPKFQSDDVGWYVRQFRDPLWRRLAKTAICLRQTGTFYNPRVRGEATASYAVLDPEVIEEIVLLNPDIKVISMIRHPVDRAWSHAKKDLSRNRKRNMSKIPDSEFREFFSSEYQRRCAQYVENCENWASFVQPRHLLVCMFDDVAARPRELLLEVMRFLGVDADPKYIGDDVHESVNPTGHAKIPPEHLEFLEKLLQPDIDHLAKRFGVSWPLGPHPLIRLYPE